MASWISRIIKGMIIALGFILPGVSGGYSLLSSESMSD